MATRKTRKQPDAVQTPYHCLFIRIDGRWTYHFGDYDKEAVKYELDEARTGVSIEPRGVRLKDTLLFSLPGNHSDHRIMEKLKELNAPPPTQPGQIVYASVIRMMNAVGSAPAEASLFTTRDAAQADCDKMNATRMGNPFYVMELTIQ